MRTRQLENTFCAVLATLLVSSGSLAAGKTGTAVVEVELDQPGSATFVFTGTPGGSVSAGQSIRADNLRPGAYTTAETGRAPGYRLLDIRCDDDNSAGYVRTATTRFNIGKDETVTCVYRYGKGEPAENTPAAPGPPNQPVATPAAPPEQPDSTPPPQPGGPPETTDCNPPDLVPAEGVWMVSNLPGTMVCSGMTMPLQPSQEPGTLEARDCGWTILGTGMSEDTADLTMHATDDSGRHYTGSIGGGQGLPMTIDFQWNVQSEELITGTLHSEVARDGMTCTMSRPFEMRYTGQ